MDWLAQIPDSFMVGLVVGLALGLFSRWALHFLAYAAAVLIVVEFIWTAYTL